MTANAGERGDVRPYRRTDDRDDHRDERVSERDGQHGRNHQAAHAIVILSVAKYLLVILSGAKDLLSRAGSCACRAAYGINFCNSRHVTRTMWFSSSARLNSALVTTS